MTDGSSARPGNAPDPTPTDIARAYDYLLGGRNDDRPIDASAVATALEALVEGGLFSRINRAWHIRVVRFLAAEAGLTQFLDLGSGLPIDENTHEVIRHLGRSARVVYVDNDPVVVTHGQDLVADDPETWFIAGDLTHPTTLLTHPVIRSHLDLTRPVGLLLSATLHHQPDERDLPAIMRHYVTAIAPGSYVALSHFWDPGGEAGAQVRRIGDTMLQHGLQGERFRSREEIAALLPGLELVPSQPLNAEGLVPVGEWWPDGPTLIRPTPVESYLLGAVGRKP